MGTTALVLSRAVRLQAFTLKWAVKRDLVNTLACEAVGVLG